MACSAEDLPTLATFSFRIISFKKLILHWNGMKLGDLKQSLCDPKKIMDLTDSKKLNCHKKNKNRHTCVVRDEK